MVGPSEAAIIEPYSREAEQKRFWSLQMERETVKFRQMPGRCDLAEKGGNRWHKSLRPRKPS